MWCESERREGIGIGGISYSAEARRVGGQAPEDMMEQLFEVKQTNISLSVPANTCTG